MLQASVGFGCFWLTTFLCLWRIYKNGQVVPKDDSLDYGANFAHMLGFDSPDMHELMRLYVTIHTYVHTYSAFNQPAIVYIITI